jgi:hypothetical protein
MIRGEICWDDAHEKEGRGMGKSKDEQGRAPEGLERPAPGHAAEPRQHYPTSLAATPAGTEAPSETLAAISDSLRSIRVAAAQVSSGIPTEALAAAAASLRSLGEAISKVTLKFPSGLLMTGLEGFASLGGCIAKLIPQLPSDEITKAIESFYSASKAFAQIVPKFTLDEVTYEMSPFMDASCSLAKAGWLFPGSLTPREVVDLAELLIGKGVDEVDRWFIEYYSEKECREFATLETELVSLKSLEPFHPLLGDATWAYRQGRYGLVVPSALVALEGTVSRLTDFTLTGETRPDRMLKHKETTVDRECISFVGRSSIVAFLGALWRRAAFSEDPPEVLNRHWILHGRLPSFGSQANALRLLVALLGVGEHFEDPLPGV